MKADRRPEPALRASRRPIVHRIVTRILLLNLLIVFLPVLSILLLDTYEEQLLDTLERSLVQQGRLIAAALSLDPELDANRATTLLRALRGRHEARLRVLDRDGNLVADSSTIARDTDPETDPDNRADAAQPSSVAGSANGAESASGTATTVPGPRESVLYRIASFPVRLIRDFAGRPDTPLPSADFYAGASYASGSEVQAALSGRYGAATRVSAGGQISVTLYSALPVESASGITGAVLVSQSTFRILQDLYQIRIDVFTIFLWSLAAAVVVSIFLALTIARPISLLQLRAREAVDEHGRLRGPLPRQRRRDEIGGLSHSLSELTEQIVRYTRRLEGFAADASHELKNPLASIAANCELALVTPDEARRKHLLTRARLDVRRAESIITGMRELSQIDARSGPVGMCDAVDAVREAVAELGARTPDHTLELAVAERSGGYRVGLQPERLYQITANLVANARSFAPPGSRITVQMTVERGQVVLRVVDEGPGFEELDRVFDRFYSSRVERNGHLGLGLSIVRAIAESVGGAVEAANRTDGAVVTVTLPHAHST